MDKKFKSNLDNIRNILMDKYYLSLTDANKAINALEIRKIFENNIEKAALASDEEWAKEIFKRWSYLSH